MVVFMSILMVMSFIALVLGLVAVASNPSPYFGALGLVWVAGMGCFVLLGYGGSILCMILFLIYLGGMLVVFIYTSSLAAEPYPENWMNRSVAFDMLMYMVALVLAFATLTYGYFESAWITVDEYGSLNVLRGDTAGVGLMYSSGGGMLLSSVWVLILTLFVALALTRGLSHGALREV